MNKQARAIGEQVVISICLIVFAYVHEVLRTKQKVALIVYCFVDNSALPEKTISN